MSKQHVYRSVSYVNYDDVHRSGRGNECGFSELLAVASRQLKPIREVSGRR